MDCMLVVVVVVGCQVTLTNLSIWFLHATCEVSVMSQALGKILVSLDGWPGVRRCGVIAAVVSCDLMLMVAVIAMASAMKF